MELFSFVSPFVACESFFFFLTPLFLVSFFIATLWSRDCVKCQNPRALSTADAAAQGQEVSK